MVFELQIAPKAEKDQKLDEMTDYINDWLESARQYRKNSCIHLKEKVAKYSCFVCGKRFGNYFMTCAMFTKVLYLTNAFVQFFALNAFLGTDFASWGFQILQGLAEDDPEYLKNSYRFPRVTLCDFQIRQMQNVQRWTVQCVLPINLFNSKIFLFIWFWLVFLCIATIMTLISNFYAIMFPHKKIEYIKKHLKLRRVYTSGSQIDRRLVARFVHSYLKFDGVYVLRVVAHNGTDVLVAQIIEVLYLKYKQRFSLMKQRNGTDIDSS